MRRFALGLWVILALLGGWLFLREAPKALPEANLQLRLSHTQARQIAERALREVVGQNLSLEGWRPSVLFDWDSDAKWYLEKTLGLEHADQVMREQVAVWFYACRWVKEGERTIYRVNVAPDGRVLAVRVAIPEEAPGASLSKEQARQIATAFLQRSLQIDLSAWRFHSDYEYKRPQRKDYALVWEHRTLKYPAESANPATVRMTVWVRGDRIGGYSLNWLHTPEKWRFEQAHNQSLRGVVQNTAEVIFLGFQIALVGVLIWLLVKRQLMALKSAFWIAVVLSVATLAGALNLMPLWWADYPPTMQEGLFLATRSFLALVSVLFGVGLVTFLWATVTDYLSRERPPAGVRMALLGTARFWITREALQALFMGLCFGLFHLGYVVLFYRFALRVGAWVPLEVPYTNAVATPLPFLEPLLSGLQPAIWEELLFRGTILYLIWRVTRRLWLAVLVSSALWAFLHTNYPVEPIYLRGVELLPVGVMFAWLAFRYGILASIAAHYTYNALLTAYTFWQMELPSLQWSALITGFGVVLLFVPALVVYGRTRSLPSASEIGTLAELRAPEATVSEVSVKPYRPLGRLEWGVAGALALGLVLLGWYSSREPDHLPLPPMVKITRAEAEQKAFQYLRGKGIQLEGYQAYAYFVDNREGNEIDYIREQVGDEAVAQFLTQETLPAYWEVLLFKPEEREEWTVRLTLDGRVWRRSALLPEEKAGARLSPAQARSIAEAYLSQERGYTLSQWRLIESDRTERPNRYDYLFVYEHRTKRYGEARLRLSVGVLGSVAVGPNIFLDIPEKWFFERRQFRSWTVLGGIWLIVLLIPSLAYLLYLSWRTGTATSFSWRLGLRVALLMVPLLLLDQLNSWNETLWADYDTSDPLSLHYLQVGMSLGATLLLIPLLVFALYGSFEPTSWKRWVPFLVPLSVWLNPRRWYEAPPDSPLRHPLAMRQAWGLSYLIALGIVGGAFFDPGTPSLEVFSPSLHEFATAGLVLFFLGLIPLLAVSLHAMVIRSWKRWVLMGLLVAPASVIGATSWKDLGEQVGIYFGVFGVLLVLGYWLARRALQGNLFGWALLLYLVLLAPEIPTYWLIGAEPLRLEAVILTLLFLLPLGVLVGIERLRARIPTEPAQAVVALPSEGSGEPVLQSEER